MNIIKVLAALIISSTTALADANFDYNAKGLSLNKVRGRTLVGVTRDTSKVFSIYLNRNKTAKFHFSTGKRKSATWRQASRNIICFKGLVEKKPYQEICKLAKPLGRGMDWMTVKIQENNGKITYDKSVKDERRGSSQIVYSFNGETAVPQNSYLSDLRKWKGHTIMGRTLKDKEAWFVNLGLDGKMDFVFGSGKRFKGTYTLTSSQICMKFFEKPAFDGCRKPAIKNGKIAWISTKTGGHTSEIVFMKQTEKPGPKIIRELSKDKYHMVLSDDRHRTLAAVKRAGTGSVELYDAHAYRLLGSIPHYARDLAFSPTGLQIAGDYKNKLWQANINTGQVDWVTELDPEITLTELAYALNNSRILVGSKTGHLYVFNAENGKQLAKHFVADSSISDIAVDKAQILIGTQAGQLFATHFNELPKFNNFHTAATDITITRLINGGTSFLALTKAGRVLKGTLGAVPSAMAVTKTVETGISPAYSLAVNPTESEMIVSYDNGMEIIKTDTLESVKVNNATSLPKLRSSSYLTNRGGFMSVISGGGLKVWARSAEKSKDVLSARSSGYTIAKNRWKVIKDIKDRKDREYKELKSRTQSLFDSGACDAYAAQAEKLPKNERKSNCEQAAIERKQLATYNRALSELRCEDAANLRITANVGSEFREKKCIDKRQTAHDKEAYNTAKADLDCTVVTQFAAKFNEAGAPDECHFQSALQGDSARKLFFAAVKMDTSNQNARAKMLYTEVMNRFPDDDLALDAAKRLTELGDKEERAKKDAENAAALKAAQQALEKAKKEQNEELRKSKLREEKAKREAAEARARAAEAQAKAARAREAEARAKAQANSRPRRNSACDHVTYGQDFKIPGGGMFGMTGYYTVVGISREGGIVTARLAGTDIQKQFSCSRVR